MKTWISRNFHCEVLGRRYHHSPLQKFVVPSIGSTIQTHFSLPSKMFPSKMPKASWRAPTLALEPIPTTSSSPRNPSFGQSSKTHFSIRRWHSTSLYVTRSATFILVFQIAIWPFVRSMISFCTSSSFRCSEYLLNILWLYRRAAFVIIQNCIRKGQVTTTPKVPPSRRMNRLFPYLRNAVTRVLRWKLRASNIQKEHHHHFLFPIVNMMRMK